MMKRQGRAVAQKRKYVRKVEKSNLDEGIQDTAGTIRNLTLDKQSLSQENQDLRQRIKALERDLDDEKSTVGALQRECSFFRLQIAVIKTAIQGSID
jgi:peptidoglycan hydrolase CwlO-like protein